MMSKTITSIFACAAAAALSLGACGGGGDDGGDDTTGMPDAAPRVVSVDCSGATIAEAITTSGFNYSPMSVTISTGQVVRFDPTAGHDVASNETGLFNVPLGGEGCFRFDAAGTYNFFCTPHGFPGSVVVQ